MAPAIEDPGLVNPVSKEVVYQLQIALPMVIFNVLQFIWGLISLSFAGHLGAAELAGAAAATSLGQVTGHSILIGMSSALETLCGQAFGAKQYPLLGVQLQRAFFVLAITALPCGILWYNMEAVLLLIGQTPEVSQMAALYMRCLLPALAANVFIQPIVRFLQAQTITVPMAICAATVLLLHAPINWLLIYGLGLGFRGAALATSVAYCINLLLLVSYICLSGSCRATWQGWDRRALHDLRPFVRLALPSALMTCVESWGFQCNPILAGYLQPDPAVQLSAISICVNTGYFAFMPAYGFSAAVSTRVSNELGAGRAAGAQAAVKVALGLAFTTGLIMLASIWVGGRQWALIFTSDSAVVDLLTHLLPIVALSSALDGVGGVLSGIVRGCGRQRLGALVNFGAYDGVGVGSAVALAFFFHLAAKGLWIGTTLGVVAQAAALGVVVGRTDWNKQRERALERLQTEEYATLPDQGSCAGEA